MENYDIYTYYNMLKNMENKTSEFIKSLLRELGVRSIDGMPDLKREDNIQHIYQILMEWGYSYSDADSFIQSLTEGSDPKDGVELSKAAKSTIDSQKLDHMGYGFYGKRGETKVDDTIMFKKLDNGELGSATKDQYDDEVENQQKLAGNADKKKDKEEETEEETPDQSSGGGESNIFDTPSGKSYMRDIPDNDPVKSKTESINIDDVLREVITILIEDDDVYSQKIKNPESGREVMVKTALSSKEHPAYQKAKSLVDKETSTDDDPTKIKKLDNKESGSDYKGKKNKKLKNTAPTQSEEYSRELEPDDTTFEKKNEKSSNPIPPSHVKLDGIIKNPKFPKRYIKAIERMLNSRATSETAKWSHFSDIPGGAGKISAQAGELMTMMGSTMGDDEWKQFKKTILDYETELIKNNPNLKKPANRIIDKSWVDAADRSRTVIQNRLKKKYGDDVEIVAGAWDSKDEVEAMGLENYKENKGFSTDVYFRVKTPDGTEILDEVSLKKSKDVNFLNSGAGKFEEWDDNLPDDINQNVYRDTQRKRNNSFISKNRDDVDKFLNSPEGAEVIKEMERKGLTFEDAIKGDSRDKQKILWLCAVEMAKQGNNNAKKVVIEADKAHKEFQEKAINAIATNEKMKEGMLQTIKEEFPLKSVSDGEETMAIGNMSLDKDTMKEIFGTSDYDEIKEKLVAEPGPPPFLGYQAEVGGDIIPIAEVAIREDGVGYGGQIKFEMKLDKRFADRLNSATKSVYG